MGKAFIGIDARGSDVLKATLLSVHVSPKAIQQNIKQYTSLNLRPAWKERLEAQPHNALQQRLLIDSSQVTTTNTNVNLRSGGVTERLSGGLSTDTVNALSAGGNPFSYRVAEFGANSQAQRKEIVSTSKRGKKYIIHGRHTQRQFRNLPPNSKGYVVYPAAREFIPIAASMWVATVVRTLHDAYEGKLK